MHLYGAGLGKGCSSTLSRYCLHNKVQALGSLPSFLLLSLFFWDGGFFYFYVAHASVKLLGTSDPDPSVSSFLPLKTPPATTKTAKESNNTIQQSVPRKFPPSSITKVSFARLTRHRGVPYCPEWLRKWSRDWDRGTVEEVSLLVQCVL